MIRARIPFHVPVLAGFVLLAALVGARSACALAAPSQPVRPVLSPEERLRLEEAALDPRLASWQREIMSSLSVDGLWSELLAQSRSEEGAVYDPVRNRLVVFGGYDGSYHNDVWALTLTGAPTWIRMDPSGTPPSPRARHTAVYDPVRDRMLVFGGSDGTTRQNDTWALSLDGVGAWTQLAPSGPLPAARVSHAAVYDPAGDRMVIFGGWGGEFLNNTWALSLGGSPAWINLAPGGAPPAGRYGHTATYDPVRGRMLVFGGYNGVYQNDVWALSLSGAPAWSAVAPSGAPPSGRYLHSAIYDPARDRLVVFGGSNADLMNDAWSLTLDGTPSWSPIAVSATLPEERSGHAAIYDPAGDRMIVYGGWGYTTCLNDAWALSFAGMPSWSELVPAGALPPPLAFAAAIYDPVRDRLVVFGGSDGVAMRNDTWVLWLAGTPVWTELAPAGTPPSARENHTAIYDPVGDRMIVFGGYDGHYRNDVWALSLSSPAWTQLTVAGAPPAGRAYHTAIYDPAHRQMVIFGGALSDGTLMQDTWTLSLGSTPAWTELNPDYLWPWARYGHAAIYDPGGGRMVIFGGYAVGQRWNDTWALTLGDSPVWTQLALTGTKPSAREGHRAVYDPVQNRMVIFGGNDGTNFDNDSWGLSLAGTPAWSRLAPAGALPPARRYAAAAYDALRDRMLVYGGDNGDVLLDLRSLSWSDMTSVAGPGGPATAPPASALQPNRPNPFSAATTIRYDIRGSGARATLSIFDVDGREIRRLADGEAGRGTHELAWDGRDDLGHAVKAGIYFCRLDAEGERETRKLVLTR